MKKLLNKKFFKKTLILATLLFIYVSISAISYAKTTASELSDTVFRLHVLANSDSAEDQALKYKVRDNLISYMNTICNNTISKEEAISIATSHLEDFQKIAEQTILENKYNYPVKVQIGNFDFPTKTYGDISLPAGTYDALRVEIGEAKGQNWWCVMFPPLCFVNETTGEMDEAALQQLKAAVSEDEYELITSAEDGDLPVVMRFKVVDWFMNLREKLKQV